MFPKSASSGRTERADSKPPRDLLVAIVEVARSASALGDPGQALLTPQPGGLDNRGLGGVARLDAAADRPRLGVVVHAHEDQVRVQSDGPLAGRHVLAPHAHADLERGRPDVFDLGLEDGDLTDLHRMQEVDVVHGAEDDRAVGYPRRGHRAGLGDPLHHAAAVDLPGRARVLGEHPLDQLRSGLGDRRHRLKEERPENDWGAAALSSTRIRRDATRVSA
jgi:hypothetical protein